MGGRVRQTDAAATVSTGGSLISSAKLKQLYATMVQCRLLTERARALRDQAPSAGLYAASMGQEAIATGCAIDLRSEDTIALAPHDSIASLVKGVPLDDIVSQIYASRTRGDIERGKRAEHPACNIIPASSSPGAQLSIATGVALCNKQKKNSNVTVAFSCKAATTLGRWHEALELAASGSLPIIFVVENNPWANPTGLKACSEEEDFTLKARTFGFPVITVDGNDVVAVYRVAYESLERVRQDGGPVLIEGKTYRLHGQTKPRGGASTAILSPTWSGTSRPRGSSPRGGKTRSCTSFRGNSTTPSKGHRWGQRRRRKMRGDRAGLRAGLVNPRAVEMPRMRPAIEAGLMVLLEAADPYMSPVRSVIA